MSATEASRRFARVLDEAESGETIIVTRGGRRIATIGPAAGAGNGAAVIDFFSGPVTLDADYESDVDQVIEAVADDAVAAWPAD